MVFERDIKVLLGTTDEDPQVTRINLARGVIHKYEVSFADGCHDMVKVRILRGLHQVWPSNAEGTHKGNGRTLSFREHYPIDFAPHELVVITSSPGTIHDHTITVRFAILPRKILTPWLLTWAEKLGFYSGGE